MDKHWEERCGRSAPASAAVVPQGCTCSDQVYWQRLGTMPLMGADFVPACRYSNAACWAKCKGKPVCLAYLWDAEELKKVWPDYTGLMQHLPCLLTNQYHTPTYLPSRGLCRSGCCRSPALSCSLAIPHTVSAGKLQPSPACCYHCLAVFSFVRNPWARAVSSWLHINKHGMKRTCQDSFAKFAEVPSAYGSKCLGSPTCCLRRFGWILEHIEPQSRCLFDANGQPVVDFIGRVEHIDQDMQVGAGP